MTDTLRNKCEKCIYKYNNTCAYDKSDITFKYYACEHFVKKPSKRQTAEKILNHKVDKLVRNMLHLSKIKTWEIVKEDPDTPLDYALLEDKVWVSSFDENEVIIRCPVCNRPVYKPELIMCEECYHRYTHEYKDVREFIRECIRRDGLIVLAKYYNYGIVNDEVVYISSDRGKITYGNIIDDEYHVETFTISDFNYDFYRDSLVEQTGEFLNMTEEEQLMEACEKMFFEINGYQNYSISHKNIHDTYNKMCNVYYEKPLKVFNIHDDLKVLIMHTINEYGDITGETYRYLYNGHLFEPDVIINMPKTVDINDVKIMGDKYIINDKYILDTIPLTFKLFFVVDAKIGDKIYVKQIFRKSLRDYVCNQC